MNVDENVVLIINGKNKTLSVKSYELDTRTWKWNIRYNNSYKVYSYSYDKVLVLNHYELINHNNYQIKYNGHVLSNIEYIWSFKDKNFSNEHWKIKYVDGKESLYDTSALEINYNLLADKQSSNVYGYLRDISRLFDLVKNDQGENVLEKRISNISFIGENSSLCHYLNPGVRSIQKEKSFDYLIFPFGCNNSQFKAVDIALKNRISVIQGPPGTGKTQTILNLITNIVAQGKTVLVVSSNNSAIENVYEKISDPHKGVGFIVASLGRAAKKKSYIIDQSGKYPDFSTWNLKINNSNNFQAEREIQDKLIRLKELFDIEENLAVLKNKRNAINTEYNYFLEHIKGLINEFHTLNFKKNLNSAKWLELWNQFQIIRESNKRTSLIQKIKLYLYVGGDIFKCFKLDDYFWISYFQYKYYSLTLQELNSEIAVLEKKLKSKDLLMSSLQSDSLDLFRYKLIDRYSRRDERIVFSEEDLWKRPEEFLREYPVILSTTFSSTTSLNKNVMYDYIIMDEASQVDIVTGALSLSCARNAVIVGDMMQLPNVVNDKDKARADRVFEKYKLPEGYRYTNSFLQSILDIIPNVECTLLREHYRCHPKIINFCNQKFYNNELKIMTEDNGEKDVVVAYRTIKGNHSRGNYSERQIDIIKHEIITKYRLDNKKTGIISPYNDQVKALREKLEGYEVDTVHKFQGREKDTIILSTVDDQISSFVDDPNLLNVAVSRAKKRFILIVSGNEQEKDGNITSLLDYIEYNNLELIHSQVRSVFDYLYKQFNEERIAYFQTHKRVSEYDSENLLYHLLKEILSDKKYNMYDFILHYPLNSLIKETSIYNEREKKYAMNPFTHLDFLIYKKMNKQPVLAIEIDGYNFHKVDSSQGTRDKLKDHILELMGLPLLRLKTNESSEKARIINMLDSL